MNPSEIITGQSLILFGILVVVFVFILRRTILGAGGAGGRKDSSGDEEIASAEAGAQALTEMLEVRLHDFAREVEGRMLTRIAVLDRLIVDADREIRQLQELLAATTSGAGPGSYQPPSADMKTSGASPTGGPAIRHPDATVTHDEVSPDDRKEAA